jgi:hypothetical protein
MPVELLGRLDVEDEPTANVERARLGVCDAVIGGDEVLDTERLAVVELGLAQANRPDGAVLVWFDLLGEVVRNLEPLHRPSHLGEAVVHRELTRGVGSGVRDVRVECVGGAARSHPDAHVPALAQLLRSRVGGGTGPAAVVVAETARERGGGPDRQPRRAGPLQELLAGGPTRDPSPVLTGSIHVFHGLPPSSSRAVEVVTLRTYDVTYSKIYLKPVLVVPTGAYRLSGEAVKLGELPDSL